jgi:hypothetical protein
MHKWAYVDSGWDASHRFPVWPSAQRLSDSTYYLIINDRGVRLLSAIVCWKSAPFSISDEEEPLAWLLSHISKMRSIFKILLLLLLLALCAAYVHLFGKEYLSPPSVIDVILGALFIDFAANLWISTTFTGPYPLKYYSTPLRTKGLRSRSDYPDWLAVLWRVWDGLTTYIVHNPTVEIYKDMRKLYQVFTSHVLNLLHNGRI